jgi:hypothetical protein
MERYLSSLSADKQHKIKGVLVQANANGHFPYTPS